MQVEVQQTEADYMREIGGRPHLTPRQCEKPHWGERNQRLKRMQCETRESRRIVMRMVLLMKYVQTREMEESMLPVGESISE